MKTGAELIATERHRQIKVEGWSADHDDEQEGPALALAAICYAAMALDHCDIRGVDQSGGDIAIYDPWPWTNAWDKRKKHACLRAKTKKDRDRGRIKCLTIAGALIAAEIDRLQRASAKNPVEES